MSRLASSSALTALLLWGCQPAPSPPAQDRHLIDRFEAALDTPGDMSLAPERVNVAGSERRSLVTRDGMRWEAPAGELGGGTFAFSISVPGPGNAIAILERTAGSGPSAGDREELFHTEAAPGSWIRRRVPLEAHGESRLVLRSEGAAVAWAEIHWLPASVGSRIRPRAPTDIVLVSIDSLRSDHLSAYGYRQPTSPHLDRLASESLWFRQVRPDGALPAPAVGTLAERLRRHGYRTAAITGGGFAAHDRGLRQGFERYDATTGEASDPKDFEIIADSASRWIEENRFHPFFLFVHASLTEGADRDRPADFYDDEIRRADHHLGRFLGGLRASGHWQDTAVVVTAGHDDASPGFGDLFDADLSPPLIVKLPGSPAAGAIDTPAAGLDVAPTLLEVAGASTEGLPGRSLAGDRPAAADGPS